MPRCIRWNWLWQWYWALQALNWHFALLFKELTTYWAKITLCCHCILETKRKHQSWLANSLQIIMIEFGWHKKYKKSLKRVCSKNKKDYKKSKILFVRNSRCVSAEYRFWSSCALSFRMVLSEGPWQGMKRGGGGGARIDPGWARQASTAPKGKVLSCFGLETGIDGF